MSNPTELLKPKQVCEILGISPAMFTRLSQTDPTFKTVRFGKRVVRMQRNDLEAYIKAKKSAPRVA